MTLKNKIINLIVFCTCFYFLNADTPESYDKPFVECHLEGQLGNQLFQIAATLAYAWDYDADPYFPDLNNSEFRISYNRDHLFFRLNNQKPPRKIQNTYSLPVSLWYSSDRIPFKKNLSLKGHFQS